MVNTKKLTTLALLLSVSLVLHYAESLLPPLVPVAGIKIGLANCITLCALLMFGRKEAAMILSLRIVLSALMYTSVSALIYSASGALLSFAVLSLLHKPLKKHIWVLSAFSAIFHNIGQVAAAALILQSGYVFWYLAPLTVSAVICGAFTGLTAQIVMKNFTRI